MSELSPGWLDDPRQVALEVIRRLDGIDRYAQYFLIDDSPPTAEVKRLTGLYVDLEVAFGNFMTAGEIAD